MTLNIDQEDTQIITPIQAEEKRLKEAIAAQIAEKARQSPTGKIGREHLENLPMLSTSPFGLRRGSAADYTAVPADKSEDPNAQKLCWRIELHGLKPGIAPQGFDLFGDVTIGRTTSEAAVDIDMEPYRASELGISRQHAMLRPTKNSLYLFDLNSTNGTRYNGIPLGSGIARALSNNDTITLGNLTFEVKIIDGPGMGEDKAAEASQWRASHYAAPTIKLEDSDKP